MAWSIREWLRRSDWVRHHPQIARLLGHDKPHLWMPQRRSVALGAGIGAAISVVPLPAQTLIAACAAVRFEAHLPTAVVVTFLSNPLTALPLWGVAWMLGALCLGQPMAWPDHTLALDSAGWAAWLHSAGMPLLVGIPLLAALLGFSFFGLTRIGWRLAVVHRWRTRRAARNVLPL